MRKWKPAEEIDKWNRQKTKSWRRLGEISETSKENNLIRTCQKEFKPSRKQSNWKKNSMRLIGVRREYWRRKLGKEQKIIFECGYWKRLGKKTKILLKEVEERGNTKQEIQTKIRKICEMIKNCQ